jgi:CubicO group peptidase (beta-lactamase class C family)
MDQKMLRRIFLLATYSFSVIIVSLNDPVFAASSKMVFPEESWQETKPETQGVDSTKLNVAVSYLKDNSGSDGVKELVIIRNGYMIWKGTDIDKMHGVWSLTKSFTSTVLGLLIDDEKATLDTLAKDYMPSMAEVYPDITQSATNLMEATNTDRAALPSNRLRRLCSNRPARDMPTGTQQ